METLNIIVVSFNTKALTLKCLTTLQHDAQYHRYSVTVIDNDSRDGSAEAIASSFPQVQVIRSDRNLGFARANNVVAKTLSSDWILLLNPDTEVYGNAVDILLRFANHHKEASIFGGRTVFPDGSLNRSSCWNKITMWSQFCHTFGLTAMFPDSGLFNSEAIADWARDSVREVDIISGCFFLIRKSLWDELGGFDLRYFMYGEEADLCLRAKELGHKAMVCPDATIMHLVGASSAKVAHKAILVAKGRVTLVRTHWPTWQVPIGIALFWMWGALRRAASAMLAVTGSEKALESRDKWREVWSKRDEWLKGY